MTDAPNNSGYWQIPKPSGTYLLKIALVISIALSGYLLSRADVRAVAFSSTVRNDQIASPTQPVDMVQPGLLNTPTSGTSDINSLITQLQDIQLQMQAVSSQLEQKYQAASLPPSGNAARTGEDVAALWAEIEQLNQEMQPLMVQLEVASANRSYRSASEWYALRTKVNTIHRRLADLMARVEVAQAWRYGDSWAGAAQWTAPASSTTNPNRAEFQQLYQSLTELQSMLRQMQSNYQISP